MLLEDIILPNRAINKTIQLQFSPPKVRAARTSVVQATPARGTAARVSSLAGERSPEPPACGSSTSFPTDNGGNAHSLSLCPATKLSCKPTGFVQLQTSQVAGAGTHQSLPGAVTCSKLDDSPTGCRARTDENGRRCSGARCTGSNSRRCYRTE